MRISPVGGMTHGDTLRKMGLPAPPSHPGTLRRPSRTAAFRSLFWRAVAFWRAENWGILSALGEVAEWLKAAPC